MFESLAHFFYLILYQPLFNSLVLIYNFIPGHDFGLSIIVLTLVIKIILFPISQKAAVSQKKLQELQPKIQEIQKNTKDNKEKQAREILDLYKTEKINPFSGLFLAIIQIPILIALYQVFWSGLNPKELVGLYGFVSNPGQINAMFLGLINLSKPNIVFAIIAGVVQYYQTKMLSPKKKAGSDSDVASMMQKQMMYIFPVFTILILFGLPSALGLYWIFSGLLSIVQQYFIFKKQL